MKKFFSIILSLLMMCSFTLTACKNNDTPTRVQASVAYVNFARTKIARIRLVATSVRDTAQNILAKACARRVAGARIARVPKRRA